MTAEVAQLDMIIITIRREFQLSSEQLVEYLNDKYVLHVACESGSPEMLGYLLGLGLSMHVKNASGNTPLYMLINSCCDTSTQTLKKISILLQSNPNNMYLRCDPDDLEDEIEFAALLQWVIASVYIDFMCNLQLSEYIDITAVDDGVDTILHFIFEHIMAWIKRGEEEVLESVINTTIYLIVHYPVLRQHAG